MGFESGPNQDSESGFVDRVTMRDKWSPAYFARDGFSARFGENSLSDVRRGSPDESQCNWNLQCGGKNAAGNFPDAFAAFIFQRGSGAKDAASFGMNANEFARRPLLKLTANGFASDEFSGFAAGFGNRPCESGFNRGDGFVEFMPVKAQGGFYAERVARAESGGLHSALADQNAAKRLGVFGGNGYFKSVLAGVSGAADADFGVEFIHRLPFGFHESEFSRFGQHRGNRGGGLRTLHGNQGAIRYFLRLTIGGKILAQVGEVFLSACGVGDDKESARAVVGDDEVVYGAAAGVEHDGVFGFSGREGGNVGGQDAAQRVGGLFAAQDNLRHVGDIKQDGAVAGGVVFGEGSGGVGKRQAPSGEVGDAPVPFGVESAQGRVLGFNGGVGGHVDAIGVLFLPRLSCYLRD